MDAMGKSAENSVKKPILRGVFRETRCLLGKRGALSTMLGTLLFCILATFAAYCFAQMLKAFVLLFPLDAYGAALWMDGLSTLGLVLFLTLAFPLWLGRLRMSGLMWQGYLPEAGELFYYFKRGGRLLRAWRIAFVALAGAFVPVGLLMLLYLCSYFVPTGLPLLIYTVAVALFALVLLVLSGFWLLTVGISVGNEEMTVRAALELALQTGKRRFFTLAAFSLYALLWLLLGILTIGVLPLFYSAHFYNLSYLRLCMALCPKEDDIQ